MAKEEKKDALTVAAGAMLALPDHVKRGGFEGRENVSSEDKTMPRLAVAQKLSPEVEKGHEKYVPGLEEGMLFNSLTGSIYGDGTVEVIVVRHEPARFIEFYPRDSKEGKGIKDFNVPAGDPRTEFGEKGEKPVATKFLESIALRVGRDAGGKVVLEPLALSFKGSSLKAGRNLRGLGEAINAPSFAAVYALTPARQTNEHGTFYVITSRFSRWTTPEEYAFAEKMFEGLKGQELVTNREEGGAEGGEPVPF